MISPACTHTCWKWCIADWYCSSGLKITRLILYYESLACQSLSPRYQRLRFRCHFHRGHLLRVKVSYLPQDLTTNDRTKEHVLPRYKLQVMYAQEVQLTLCFCNHDCHATYIPQQQTSQGLSKWVAITLRDSINRAIRTFCTKRLCLENPGKRLTSLMAFWNRAWNAIKALYWIH